MGVAFLYAYFSDPTGGLPKYEELTEIEGEIDWVTSHRYGIRFGLKDNPQKLNYPSKMNALGLVRESLTTASGNKLVVLTDLNDPHSPIYSDNVYYDVFEISVADRIVRSYEESANEWLSDQRLSPYLGAFFVVSGFIILWQERKWRRPPGSGQPK